MARGREGYPEEERVLRAPHRIPLHGHADQRGDIPRGHQQYTELGRGPQHIRHRRAVRDMREDASDRSAEGQGCADGRKPDRVVQFLRANRSRTVAHDCEHVADRGELPRENSKIPRPGQLLHDRLDASLARGRPAGRCNQIPRRDRSDAEGEGRLHRDVPILPHVHPGLDQRLSQEGEALQLRDPDLVPRAHQHFQGFAREEEEGGSGREKEVRGGVGKVGQYPQAGGEDARDFNRATAQASYRR